MNRGIHWIISCVRTFLAEFFGQLLGLLFLFGAFVAWAYFDSIYAAVPVGILGVLVIGLLYGLVEGKKNEGDVEKWRKGG